MQKIIKLMVSLLCVFSIVSCAFTKHDRKSPVESNSGFLPNYKILGEPVESDNITVYRYINPDIKRSDYTGVIIDPIRLYQNTKDDQMATSTDESSIDSYRTTKVTKQQLVETESVLNTYINQMVSKKFDVVNTPAKGIARLSIAITGAELDKDGLRINNVMPISAAIKLASVAAGIDNKRAVLIIEAKVVDSTTGTLMGEAYSIVSGEKFRNEVHTSQEFQTLAKNWVDMAIKFAASNNPKGVNTKGVKVNPINPNSQLLNSPASNTGAATTK